MDPKAISKAKARLSIARKQLSEAGQATNHSEFADAWYLFLIAAKNVYTTLEQGAKASPQSRQWFGAKKQQRKTDELLQYLFQARDDDEHGIADVTKLEPGFIGVGKPEPGFSKAMSMSASTDSQGRLTIHNLKSHDGLPILVESKPARSVLLPVTGRGNIVYPPPTTHLGRPLTDNQPMTVGELALAYLESLVADAEERAA